MRPSEKQRLRALLKMYVHAHRREVRSTTRNVISLERRRELRAEIRKLNRQLQEILQ